MCRVRVAAINSSWRNDAQWRAFALHRPDLYARSVRAQYGFRIEIEGILHRPCRMVFRDVQRGEIVKVVFDFRTILDDET